MVIEFNIGDCRGLCCQAGRHFIISVLLSCPRHMPHLPRVWGEPVHCHFPLFDFIAPLPLSWMYILYLVMLIGGSGLSDARTEFAGYTETCAAAAELYSTLGTICIALGIVFGFTVWLYVIPYW